MTDALFPVIPERWQKRTILYPEGCARYRLTKETFDIRQKSALTWSSVAVWVLSAIALKERMSGTFFSLDGKYNVTSGSILSAEGCSGTLTPLSVALMHLRYCNVSHLQNDPSETKNVD
jgi:hypothetical protein